MNDKYFIPAAVLLAAVIVAGALIYTKIAPSQQSASLKEAVDNQEQQDQKQDENQPAQNNNQDNTPTTQEDKDSLAQGIAGVATFYDKASKEICKQDNKPVVYLFSTTWCPHCQWVTETFDRVAKEYVSQGKIIASHWELDTNDDTLTDAQESSVPAAATAAYQEFNPRGSIPTFVFGCKYYRVGNGYERTDSLEDEEKEFRALIDYLITNS